MFIFISVVCFWTVFFFHLLVFPYITVHLTSHWHHTLEPAYEIESICRELLLATPFRGRHRGSSAMSPYSSVSLTLSSFTTSMSVLCELPIYPLLTAPSSTSFVKYIHYLQSFIQKILVVTSAKPLDT